MLIMVSRALLCSPFVHHKTSGLTLGIPLYCIMMIGLMLGSKTLVLLLCFSSLQLSDAPTTSHDTDIPKVHHQSSTNCINSKRRNTMVPPKHYSIRIDGHHEEVDSSKTHSDFQQANWINGIITCLKPVWSFIGRATAIEEKLKGLISFVCLFVLLFTKSSLGLADFPADFLSIFH